MTLTFQIDDRNLSLLKESLRISYKDWQECMEVVDTNDKNQYAQRILRCRWALGLSQEVAEACFDPPKEPPTTYQKDYK